MTTVAIIPARQGSKGIVGKNLTILNGKPLVQYSIEAAMQAHSIDIVVLTTDWPDVSKLGKKLGWGEKKKKNFHPPPLPSDNLGGGV